MAAAMARGWARGAGRRDALLRLRLGPGGGARRGARRRGAGSNEELAGRADAAHPRGQAGRARGGRAASCRSASEIVSRSSARRRWRACARPSPSADDPADDAERRRRGPQGRASASPATMPRPDGRRRRSSYSATWSSSTDDRLRRRHRGDGLRARLPGAGGRSDRRRGRRGRPRPRAGPRADRRDDRRHRRAAAPAPPGRRPPRRRLARRQHRGGARRARPRRRARAPSPPRSTPRWGGCADDAASRRWRSPRRRRQLRQRALRRLHDPDPAQHPDLVRAADALQPGAARGARLHHRDDRPLPEHLPPLPAADRRAAAMAIDLSPMLGDHRPRHRRRASSSALSVG